jgi:hypothetical protein
VKWDLQDKAGADFLSKRLVEVLEEIDEAMLRNSPQDSNDSKQQQDDGSSSSSSCCLIHCAFGISRSAAIVAAWLISRRKCTTVSDALAAVRQVRSGASPNLGFVAALRAIEQCDGDVGAAMQRMKQKVPSYDKQNDKQESQTTEEIAKLRV